MVCYNVHCNFIDKEDLSMDWGQIGTTILNFCLSFAWKIILSLLVLLLGNLLIKFILKKIATGKASQKMDPTALTFICSFLKIGLYAVLGISIVGILGVETASVITVLATAGAALALALQGSLSNMAGGLMLLIFRPFRVGDFLEACGNSGTVIEVGIFYTVVRTGDNRHVTIPNGSLLNSVMINYSKEQNRRVDIELNVAYGTDVEAAKDLVMSIVKKHEKVLTDPAPFIRMTEMADSSLKVTLRVWADSANYWDVKFDLTESINKAFVENSISIPFPQMDVHIKND